ncbi:MAG: Gfo/Idh/MocA family oxidoreductase [Gemmatimonadota bacterium]
MSAKARHRVGVVGYGVWGTHALQEYLARLPGVELAAVTADDRWGHGVHADPAAAARAYAAQEGRVGVEDWRAVVDDPQIDILSVMASPASKLEPILAALARGKSVVTDKPLAFDRVQAEQAAAAAALSQGVGFVLCGNHYSRAGQRLRQVLADGELGEVKHADLWLYFTGGVYPGFRPTARYRREVPGGELTVIGCHAIQTLLAAVGRRPQRVWCRLGQRFYPEYAEVGYEDGAELLLAMEGGVTATVSVGRLPHRPPVLPPLMEVTCTRGFARLAAAQLTLWPGPRVMTDSETVQERYDRVFGDFLRAVEEGGPSPISFRELALVQRVLEGAYAAAASGRPVDLTSPATDAAA